MRAPTTLLEKIFLRNLIASPFISQYEYPG
jgi:hypothetical protein